MLVGKMGFRAMLFEQCLKKTGIGEATSPVSLAVNC